MKCLTERMNLAKTILHELSRESLRRTELELRTVRKIGTHESFDGIMRYLISGGYVQKATPKHCSNYTITERGTKLLEAIR